MENILESDDNPLYAAAIERAILGAIITGKSNHAIIFSTLTPNVFFKEDHGLIFEMCSILFRENRPVDRESIINQLRKTGSLELLGGSAFISLLSNEAADPDRIEGYVSILKKKQIERTIKSVDSTIHWIYGDIANPSLQFLMASRKLYEKPKSPYQVNFQQIRSVLDNSEINILSKKSDRGRHTGINTGLYDLNQLTGGWHPSNLIILASCPGIGKTALMLHFAKTAAIHGFPVCIYSLENNGVKLADRLMLSACSMSLNYFHSGNMSGFDIAEYDRARQILVKLPIYIDDNSNVSMEYIRSHSIEMHKHGMCEIIFIDYLQLIDVKTRLIHEYNQADMAELAKQARRLSRDLKVPVFLLSQLRTHNVSKIKRRPYLSDLRRFGAIDQYADLLIFMHRMADVDKSDPYQEQVFKSYTELLIQNAPGKAFYKLPISHNNSMTRFYDQSSPE